MKRTLIFILIFYFLILFETSFLSHFDIFQGRFFQVSLILILIFFINLFEKPQSYSGLWSASIGGFFLDIFSENFIGFYTIISIILAIFIKFIIKKYVKIPFDREF